MLRVGSYFFGMYAPPETVDRVPPHVQIIPPVVASVVGVRVRVEVSTAGLVVTFLIVAVITPVVMSISATLAGSCVATPTPNELSISATPPQSGKYPFSVRKAIRPLDTLLIAWVTSVNLALIVWAWYIGMAIAAKIPMMAITINNSINVKPFSLLNIIKTSFFLVKQHY
jgi:hypothetical protein